MYSIRLPMVSVFPYFAIFMSATTRNSLRDSNFPVEPGRGSSEFEGRDDETSSTSSEKYERDVTVLNHCFDDIEKFIARLQHAAAASRELERRQKYVYAISGGVFFGNAFVTRGFLFLFLFGSCLGVENQKRKIWEMEC